MVAGGTVVVSTSGTLLLSQEGSSLEVGGQGSPRNHHGVPGLLWQHGGSMLSSVKKTVIL